MLSTTLLASEVMFVEVSACLHHLQQLRRNSTSIGLPVRGCSEISGNVRIQNNPTQTHLHFLARFSSPRGEIVLRCY